VCATIHSVSVMGFGPVMVFTSRLYPCFHGALSRAFTASAFSCFLVVSRGFSHFLELSHFLTFSHFPALSRTSSFLSLSPANSSISDAPSVDENGRILFKQPTKHKLDTLQKTKESKSKKSKTSTSSGKTADASSAPKTTTTTTQKKEAPKNTGLLSFEDDE
jgi:hypothetical protein